MTSAAVSARANTTVVAAPSAVTVPFSAGRGVAGPPPVDAQSPGETAMVPAPSGAPLIDSSATSNRMTDEQAKGRPGAAALISRIDAVPSRSRTSTRPGRARAWAVAAVSGPRRPSRSAPDRCRIELNGITAHRAPNPPGMARSPAQTVPTACRSPFEDRATMISDGAMATRPSAYAPTPTPARTTRQRVTFTVSRSN